MAKAREEERARAKAEEEERLAELSARVQQLRDAHEKSATAMADKERELQRKSWCCGLVCWTPFPQTSTFQRRVNIWKRCSTSRCWRRKKPPAVWRSSTPSAKLPLP